MDGGLRPEPSRGNDFGLKWIGQSTGASERRQIVVLAIGFEPAAAADPEDIVEALHIRRTLVARTAARYSGSLARVDPNLQIVCWGWPLSHEADARLAVAAALEVASQRATPARCSLDVGIAIAPSHEDALKNSVLVCEALNTSVLYQSYARAGQVFVSDAVAALVDGFFHKVEAPLLPDGRQCWSLAAPSTGGPRQQQPVELIGRTAEFAILADCWRIALRGGSRSVCIEGDAGIGKSALARQLARLVTETGGRAISVACLPERRQQGSWIAEQLNARLLRLLQICPDEGEALRSSTQAGQLLPRLTARAARQWPLTIIVSDATWIDAVSATALAGLHPIDQVLLVETRRPPTSGLEKSTRRSADSVTIELGPMSLLDIEALVRRSPDGIRLSEKNIDLVCRHAEGNPLYALELARLCAERPDSNSHHRLLSGPNRLNAHLTGRLDALSDLKPLAQAAAVVGRLFDARVLAAVLGIEMRCLTERLQLLVQTGILSERRDRRAQRYRFKHALLWSQAYGSVLKSRRRELHLTIARELTGRIDADSAIRPEIVAHHWKKAGRPAEAFAWWYLSAHSAAARGADAISIDCINEALAAKEETPDVSTPLQEAELMGLLARQQQTLRGGAAPEAITAYEAATSLLESAVHKPTDLDLDIAWGLASIHLVRGDVKLALIASGKLIGEAQERGRGDIKMLALRIHGTANMLSGRVAEAIELLAGAYQLSDSGTDCNHPSPYICDPAASALAHLASAYAIVGDKVQAHTTRQRALERAAHVGDAHTTSNILGVLALGAIHLGETGPAAALARASEEIASRHRYTYWAARGALIQAWAAARRTPGRGIEAMRAALEIYRCTGAGRASVIAHCLTAEVALDARQPGEALALLTPFRNKGHLQGEWLYIPEVLRLQAIAHAMIDPRHRDDALQLLAQAEDLAAEHGSQPFLFRIRTARESFAKPKTRRSRRARAAPLAAE